MLIVRTVIQSSKTVNTIVVTDLLILLLYHADIDGKTFVLQTTRFKSGGEKLDI